MKRMELLPILTVTWQVTGDLTLKKDLASRRGRERLGR